MAPAIRLRQLWLVTLVGLALLATLLPAPRAAADHTPVPGTVTLVGSLQAELGCPSDWQPDCAATRLQPTQCWPRPSRPRRTRRAHC